MEMNTKNFGILGTVGVAVALLETLAVAKPANAQAFGVVVGAGPGIQADKNFSRNAGIGLGAAAAYELTHGRGRAALAFGVGAAIAGERYEADRRIEAAPVVCEPVRPVRWGVPYVAPVYVEHREPLRYGRPFGFAEHDRYDFGRDHRVFAHAAWERDRHDGWYRR